MRGLPLIVVTSSNATATKTRVLSSFPSLSLLISYVYLNPSLFLFVWLLVDFVRDWRFEFGFEMWDFVVVFGLILARICGGGRWMGFSLCDG